MKNLCLKSTGYPFYATLLAILSIATLSATEPSRADLLTQLIERLGPEKAADFMARLEAKHAQTTPKTAEIPAVPVVEQPVIVKTPAVESPVEIQAPEAIPAPVVDPAPQPAPVVKPTTGFAITTEDRHHFNHIATILETYTHNVYKCIDAFFSKKNFEPYRSHIQCFRTQLQYLREELLHQYPQPQTAEAAKLFKSLEIVAQSLDKSQETMINTLDANFGTGMFSGTKLGMAMGTMEGLIAKQRALVNKEIGALRNQLRSAKETEMLKKIDTFYAHLNKNFDYGNNKDKLELLSILNHRVKR